MNRCDTDSGRRAKAAARTITTIVIALTSTIVIALAGCADSGGIVPLATRIDPAAAGATGTTTEDGVASDWWLAVGDPELTGLIERATAGSPTLRVAQARVALAAAAAGVARAARGPLVTGSVDESRQRFTANGLYPPPFAGAIENVATAQIDASWEIDLFGRNRAALDAALGRQRAAEADAAAARVLLAVNVGRTYVQLARLFEQREVLERAIGQRDQILSLIRQRVSAGLDTAVELRQGEGALPETRQQIEATDEQIALTRHALAALAALPPDACDALMPKLVAVHAVPVPDVVPANLVGRRADIVAARWRVEAATRDVAAAHADFYPNIDIVAFAGLSSIGLKYLSQSDSAQYGIGPAIRLPIFDSGRLRANLSGRTADLDAAIESYNGSLIEAIRDVADQISSARSLERQQHEEAAALAFAEAAYDLATQRYRAGLATYLTVLNAETNVLVQRQIAVDLRARSLDSQLLLVRALGGGYVASAAAS